MGDTTVIPGSRGSDSQDVTQNETISGRRSTRRDGLGELFGSADTPSYGFILETQYADGVPAGQLSALADGVLTEEEVERATRASDACVAAVPGIASVDPFRWVEQDGEFSGGNVAIEEGADREVALEAAGACYLEYAGLIEFAWLDQWYFGEWTDENLRD